MILAYRPDLTALGGSAGIDNLLNPIAARGPDDALAANVLPATAQLLAAANPDRLEQVASSVEHVGGGIALAHTAQVLDASIRGRCEESLRVSPTSTPDQHQPFGEVTSTTPFLRKTR